VNEAARLCHVNDFFVFPAIPAAKGRPGCGIFTLAKPPSSVYH
jgi:hypothetical protein